MIHLKKLSLFVAATVLTGGLLSSSYAAPLPEVKILATGGTIAGNADSYTQTTGYKAGVLGIDVLLSAVPEIKEYAKVSGEQIANIGSENMTNDIWLKLAERCNTLLADPKIKGIVITHGTDTLEETAYFLNLVVKSDKPVILVGSMRPASAISADGPLNLLNAVKLAVDKNAVGKGVLVALNDEISSARNVTKTNTTNVSTFKSPELGFLGYITDGVPMFYQLPLRRHTKDTVFDLKGVKKLPRVDIIYTHVNDDRALIDAAVASGAEGIVYAGSGMGSIHKDAEPGLYDARAKGVQVVRSSRVGNGQVVAATKEWTEAKFIDGDNLNPQKARILLQLALTKTHDPDRIQQMFNEY